MESADVIARELQRRFGASSAAFLIADFSGKSLVRMGAASQDDSLSPKSERIALFGSVYGEAIRSQQCRIIPGEEGGAPRIIAPVTNRGDAIGLLELTLAEEPGEEALQEMCADLGVMAHVLAYVVIANERFTDLYHWGRRTRPLSLAAEIQHQLLPRSLACEAAQFAVAGAFEPAESIGGDTFDYVLDRHHLHLSVTDAMGHHVDAALIASLLVGALRGARRADVSLTEQARQADLALAAHGRGAFSTGQLLRVDLRDGQAHIINAGHPLPLRVRGSVVEQILLEVDLPFGMPFPHTYTAQSLELLPGDRLVMFTDGMLEHAAHDLDLTTLLEGTRGDHPREAAFTLTRAVLDANGGSLEDDATLMVLDWYGPHLTQRDAVGGADTSHASPPAR
ncbi:PP2C family protein-serine/threonine phosphatase [Streptomyces sp. NPDC059837]|uniref:PP2C family protein-serine/threonine phosphatase n=1 Tax=Streptomyces sp. NPDC059837 TaxID=3346968 RepID=UPI0036621BE4